MIAPSSSLTTLQHGDVAGLAVEVDANALGRDAVGGDVLGVRGQDRLLDDGDEFFEGDRLLLLDPSQQTQFDVHDGLSIQLSSRLFARATSVPRYPVPTGSRTAAAASGYGSRSRRST